MDDELALHTRRFEEFLHQIERSQGADYPAAAEAQCLYHLDRLFFLLYPRGAWGTIAAYANAVQRCKPRERRHQQQLALYAGLIAIQAQEYAAALEHLLPLAGDGGADGVLRLRAHNSLGQLFWYQARYDRALEQYRQVYELAVTEPSAYYQGVALLNMSQVYSDLDDPRRALELLETSVPVFRELRDELREAHVTYELAKNATLLGEWPAAEDYLARAHALYQTLGMRERTLDLAWLEGLLSHLVGDEPRSEQAFRTALDQPDAIRSAYPAVEMDVWLYLGFLYQTQSRWDAALAAYEQAERLAGQVGRELSLALIQFRRGTVFQRQGRAEAALAAYAEAIDGIEALRGEAQSEEIKIGLVGTAQQAYESIVLLLLEQGRAEEAFHYVERARSRAFLDLLTRRDPELFARFDQPVATLAEVQAALPADALLVEYFTSGVVPRGEHLLNRIPKQNTRLREHLALPAQTWVFAVSRSGFMAQRTTLDPNTLRPHPGDPEPAQRLLRERLLVTLYEQAIAPLQPMLAGCTLLYLVPHGPLHYLPFMALRSATGEHLLHSGGPAIAMAPSATVLLRNCLGRRQRSTGAALALGYNDEGGQRLQHAEAEAAHVSRLVGGAALVGGAQKRETLLTAGGLRLLHVAGHAEYNPLDPLASTLQLGPGETITAREISAAGRPAADLVTLSACSSGVSLVGSGDELFGLQRAFLSAGAAAVVCTLWEAADTVALLVMDHFYRALLAGTAPAAALRDAQATLRAMTGADLLATFERWRAEAPQLIAALGELPPVPPEYYDTAIFADPVHWAPFMLIGRS
jgi:CHAT domain-containing protein/tetratricopeptide (TPR) repeat protein